MIPWPHSELEITTDKANLPEKITWLVPSTWYLGCCFFIDVMGVTHREAVE